ncbi:hypothetical protein A6R68_09791, partial [Neotoma lepida]
PSKMPKGKKAKGKKVALAPAIVKKQEAKKMMNPLFETRPKNFCIGQDISPKEISHTLHQMTCLYQAAALDRQTATQLLKLAHSYGPETKQEKQQRLLAHDEKMRRKLLVKGNSQLRGPVLPAEVNTVTTLVENKKTQLVLTTHMQTPLSWWSSCLPCVARWGPLLHHQGKGQCYEIHCHWGGKVLGPKSVARIAKLEKAKAKELSTDLSQ